MTLHGIRYGQNEIHFQSHIQLTLLTEDLLSFTCGKDPCRKLIRNPFDFSCSVYTLLHRAMNDSSETFRLSEAWKNFWGTNAFHEYQWTVYYCCWATPTEISSNRRSIRQPYWQCPFYVHFVQQSLTRNQIGHQNFTWSSINSQKTIKDVFIKLGLHRRITSEKCSCIDTMLP